MLLKIKSLSATFAHPTARMKVLEKHKEGKIQRKLFTQEQQEEP